jgi:DEAD/DEAH box helicase domain-containing protein
MFPEDFEGYLRDSEKEIDVSKKVNNKEGDFYLLPDIQFNHSDFFNFKLGIRLNDFSFKSAIYLNEKVKTKLSKGQWEDFWRIFNLVQFGLNIPTLEEENVSENTASKYDCLLYHDPMVHEIVKQLIDNKIEFEKEGGFYLENNGLYAEAMLGFYEQKIFINALSEEDKQIFIKAGYQEVLTEDFNLKLLK